MADIDFESLRDVERLSEAQSAIDQRNLRGRSARGIEFYLRAEAMKNLNKSQELADIRKFQRENAAAHFIQKKRHYLKLLDEGTNLIDEERFTAPLGSLSRELRGYEEKSSNYFLDKRYRHPTRPSRLYGCLGIRPA